MSPLRCPLALLATTAAVLAGDAKSPVATANGGNWEFSISAGLGYRQAGTLGFRGGSRAGGLVLPSFVGNNSRFVPSIGDAGKIGDRGYDDGYVRRDLGTAGDGLTTNWGYQNSSQAGADEIAFHATGFQSIRSGSQSLGSTFTDEDDQRGIAPILGFDAKMKDAIHGFQPGFSATLSWMPVRMDHGWSDFQSTQRRDDFRLDYTDRYNLGGVGAFLPGAPYSGSATAPGFVLENIPDSRMIDPVLIGSGGATISNRVSTRFRADHTTLSFGPTVEREISKTWSLQAGAGLSLHWLSWSARQRETLTVRKKSGATRTRDWSDSASGDRILPGMYLQIGSEWKPAGHAWSVRSFLRGDLGKSADLGVGPSEYTYETDGYTAAVMLALPL